MQYLLSSAARHPESYRLHSWAASNLSDYCFEVATAVVYAERPQRYVDRRPLPGLVSAFLHDTAPNWEKSRAKMMIT